MEFNLDPFQHRMLMSLVDEALQRAEVRVTTAEQTPKFGKLTLDARRRKRDYLRNLRAALPDAEPLPGL